MAFALLDSPAASGDPSSAGSEFTLYQLTNRNLIHWLNRKVLNSIYTTSKKIAYLPIYPHVHTCGTLEVNLKRLEGSKREKTISAGKCYLEMLDLLRRHFKVIQIFDSTTSVLSPFPWHLIPLLSLRHFCLSARNWCSESELPGTCL